RRRFVQVAALALLAMASAVSRPESARAQSTPSADEIIRQMKAALEPPRPSLRKMDLTFDDRGTITKLQLAQARKRFPDGDRTLTVMLGPEGARGIAYLTMSPANGPAVEYLYVPVVRRIRKLVPAENYQSFLDTDFSYADLGMLPLETTNELLGTEVIDGRKAYKVQSIPTSVIQTWYYARTVTWIDAETLLPMRREFYSPAGEVFKVETFGSVSKVDGVPTPLQIRMQTLASNTSSTLDVTAIDYDVELPDELFDPEKLRFASE